MDVAEINRCFAAIAALKGNGYSNEVIEQRRALHAALAEAASPEHAYKIVGATMDDTCECACGWKSQTYWDGADYAYSDWQTHLKTVLQ